VFWGQTLLGIPFGLRTLYYAPARTWFLAYVAIVALLTGYCLRRDYHVRLIPKLELTSLYTTRTPTNAPNLERIFVQLLVRCKTEGHLEDCKGHLLEVSKWSAFNKAWQPTQSDEAVDLLWSTLNVHSTVLEPGLDRRLNLLFIDTHRWILPRETSVPVRTVLTHGPGDIFRFHIRVSAKECLPQYAFIKATFGQNWDDIEVGEIENGQVGPPDLPRPDYPN